ncbi:MAG: hypothetical protein OT477_05500 [Chloroflexi bacterium]|nr:hypothetical protein [Chloroflexota bacterium]
MQDNPHFQATVTAVRDLIATWPSPLRNHALEFFERQLPGLPMQIITLLPYLVHELIPTPTAALAPLSEAHLLAAWYYHAQDDLLDEQHDPTIMLGGHMALLEAIRRYEGLGLASAACWPQFFTLAERASQAYTQEWLGRFGDVSELTAEKLEPFTLDFIGRRAAPLFFNTQAQLELAGIPPHDERVRQLLRLLEILNLSLQIGDDLGDWLADLQAGHLNVVGAWLIRHHMATYPEATFADLSLEGLVGYQLLHTGVWDELEQTLATLYNEARAILEPYGRTKLGQILETHIGRMANTWDEVRQQQVGIQAIFIGEE